MDVPPDLPEGASEFLEQHFPGGFTPRDEANAIVAWAIRNGPIEDLYAGKPSKLLKDRSLSRITDGEVKELILYACGRVEELLRLKESDPQKYAAMIRTYGLLYCRKWRK